MNSMIEKGLSKVKDIIKEEKIKYLIALLIMYICSFFYCFNLGENRWYYLLMFFSVNTIIVPIVYICKKKEIKIEKIFVIISIILGSLYMFSIPIGAVPDEDSHFLRAYEITYGNFISKVDETNGEGYGEFSEDIDNYFYKPWVDEFSSIEQIKRIFDEDSQNTKKYTYSNTSLYSFVCYTPQSVGIILGRLCGLNIIGCAYLGRIVNFGVWIAIMYFAIKKLPFYKNILLFIALLPITLQEAISLSADTLTIAICIFFISYIFNLTFVKEGKLNNKEYAILTISTLVVSLCKIVYMPLCLLLLIIPVNKFENKKKKYFKLGLVFITTVIVNLIWLTISSRYLIEFNGGVDEKGQIIYILSNPLRYINILYLTLCYQIDFYLMTFFGQSLESFNVNLSENYTYLMVSIFTVMFLKEKSDISIGLKERIISVVTLIVIILLIFTAIYVQWTPMGNNWISGVQGRYFTPIAILLPIVMNRRNKKEEKSSINTNLMFLFFTIINLYAVTNIFIEHLK